MQKMVNKTTNNYILSISEVQRFTKALTEVLESKKSKTIGSKKTGIQHKFEYHKGINGKSDFIRITRIIEIKQKPKTSKSSKTKDVNIEDIIKAVIKQLQ